MIKLYVYWYQLFIFDDYALKTRFSPDRQKSKGHFQIQDYSWNWSSPVVLETYLSFRMGGQLRNTNMESRVAV